MGFIYLHYKCTDIDECQKSRRPCQGEVHCTNTVGSFICGCRQGYKTIVTSNFESVKKTQSCLVERIELGVEKFELRLQVGRLLALRVSGSILSWGPNLVFGCFWRFSGSRIKKMTTILVCGDHDRKWSIFFIS